MPSIPTSGKGKSAKMTMAQMSLWQAERKRKGCTQRAGLVAFSPARVKRRMRALLPHKQKYIRNLAAVYMAAVLEYMMAELLELSGCVAHERELKRISPRCILLAIKTDSEMDQLLRGTTIPEGGVDPHIHRQLLPKSARGRSNP